MMVAMGVFVAVVAMSPTDIYLLPIYVSRADMVWHGSQVQTLALFFLFFFARRPVSCPPRSLLSVLRVVNV